jgi:hypothetical protein
MNLEYEREINSLQKFFYYLLSAHLNIQQVTRWNYSLRPSV